MANFCIDSETLIINNSSGSQVPMANTSCVHFQERRLIYMPYTIWHKRTSMCIYLKISLCTILTLVQVAAMEVKQEPDSCDERGWINVPPPNIGLTENCIPNIKAETPDPCSGPSSRHTLPDYAVDVWVPDIKEECVSRSLATLDGGSRLTSDNSTQRSCSDISELLERARSPIVQAQLHTRHTSSNGEQPGPCEGILSDKHCARLCSQINTSLTRTRLRTLEKPFSCDDCKKNFSRRGHLSDHLKTHTGEKPFACEQCGKVFSQKSHLISHLKTHTGKKPFACENCEKSFCRKDQLLNHLKTHTGEKPFACEECEKVFSQKGHLLSHLRTHTGEKPFICEDCKKSFSRWSALTRHKKTHSVQRPFACKVCKKTFNVKSSLVRHLKIHSGEKLA